MKKFFTLLALLAMLAPLSLSVGCDTAQDEAGVYEEEIGEEEIGEEEVGEPEVVE